MPDYLKVLIPSAIGLITTICAAYFSARWAMRRAFQERWWERKEKAYREIIEALHNIVRYLSICSEEDLLRKDHPKSDEFQKHYSDAHWKIEKMTDVGTFIISERAATILQKLRDRPKLDWDDGPPWEFFEAECTSYRDALNEIRTCAKKDLNI